MNQTIFFMKTKILDALKAKFEGVSDAILGRIAEKLAKTTNTEEEVTTVVEGVTIQQILESYGDSRATEAQQSAVTNYEKKHGLKDGKKVEEPKPKPGEKGPDDKDVPEWAQALIESNKALTEKLATIEGEKTTNNRKTILNKTLENAPEKIRQRYEKDFERMNFNDDEDFNAWIGEITPDVEEITKDFAAKGSVVTRPRGGAGGGGGNDKVNPYLEARIKEKAAETAAPAILGLTNNK